jgi:2-oxo-3-hexenedioate decarboxylase
MAIDHAAIADALITAYDSVTTLPPITARLPHFSVQDGYTVLSLIEARRRGRGWQPMGRKIGFTNRTIWPRYGVNQPMWAHIWRQTVSFISEGEASFDLLSMVQPRIEPEVVFKLKGPVPHSDDPVTLLCAVEWLAPGFELVQSHYPNWKFQNADCTAAFGLHGALLVGAPLAVTDGNREKLARLLPTFSAALTCDGRVIDRGIGANVLDSPALALGHLAQVLATQPQFPPLAAGEIVTTGTITDAAPVKAGEIWRADYGELGLEPITCRFTPGN